MCHGGSRRIWESETRASTGNPGTHVSSPTVLSQIGSAGLRSPLQHGKQDLSAPCLQRCVPLVKLQFRFAIRRHHLSSILLAEMRSP